jgi:hypothetical protein
MHRHIITPTLPPCFTTKILHRLCLRLLISLLLSLARPRLVESFRFQNHSTKSLRQACHNWEPKRVFNHNHAAFDSHGPKPRHPNSLNAPKLRAATQFVAPIRSHAETNRQRRPCAARGAVGLPKKIGGRGEGETAPAARPKTQTPLKFRYRLLASHKTGTLQSILHRSAAVCVRFYFFPPRRTMSPPLAA